MAEPLCPARPLNCCILQGRNVPPGQVGRCTCPCHEEPPPIRSDAPDAHDGCRALLEEFATAADLAGPGLRYSAPHVAEKLAALAVRARRMLQGDS